MDVTEQTAHSQIEKNSEPDYLELGRTVEAQIRFNAQDTTAYWPEDEVDREMRRR